MPQEKKRKVASAQDGKPSSSSTSSAEAGAVGADWEWSGKLVQNFLLTASPDMRQVWEMALSVSPKDPCAAFKSVGVTLCGPFDMMAGKLNAELATQRSILANIHISIFIAWLSSMHATVTSSMQPVGWYASLPWLSMSSPFRVAVCATLVPLCTCTIALNRFLHSWCNAIRCLVHSGGDSCRVHENVNTPTDTCIDMNEPIESILTWADGSYMLTGRRKRDGLPWSLHSRHRYDPPEVVTVALLDDGRRWCYHRDSPEEEPHAVVASVSENTHSMR